MKLIPAGFHLKVLETYGLEIFGESSQTCPGKILLPLSDILFALSDKLVMFHRHGGWGGEKSQR